MPVPPPPTPLEAALLGAGGGALGAVLLAALIILALRGRPPGPVEVRLRDARLTAGRILSEVPGRPPSILAVAATLAQKIATGLFGRSLSPAAQRWAGAAWHVGYGAAWGAVYGVVATSVPLTRSLVVTLFAFAVWFVGPGWLAPAMRLMLPARIARPAVVAFVLLAHAVYAATVAAVVASATGRP